jgi:hypothetical protein
MDLTGLGSVADLIKTGINKIFPDKNEEERAKLALMLAELQGEIDLAKGQQTTNTAEAQSQSVFVSGWRPGVGWTCGAGLACQFVVFPLITWIADLFGKHVTSPNLDMGTLLTLLLGMLGLGGLRTAEKIKGVK